MLGTRSEKYYFSTGNVVLKIQETLFKIHDDIVGSHSAYLKEAFANSLLKPKEGQSDKTPLGIPKDICGANEFSTICEFIYPDAIGVSSEFSIDDLDRWEPVWDAAFALQMTSLQKLISQRIRANKAKMTRMIPRLLAIARRLEEDELKWDCYLDLVYRAHPITPAECAALGLDSLIILMTAREKTRNQLAWHLSYVSVDRNESCTARTAGPKLAKSARWAPPAPGCRQAVLDAIREEMKTPTKDRTFGSVFNIEKYEGMCSSCTAIRSRLALSCRRQLDPMVRVWLSELESPLVGDDTVMTQGTTVAESPASD